MKNIFIEPQFSDFYKDSPLILVDVGASGGLQKHWRAAQKYLQVIGFEPDEREFKNLESQNNQKIKYLKTGLYKEKASLKYYLAKNQQASSIFEPNRLFLDQFPESERFDVVGSAFIEVDTLDNQLKLNNILNVDFIKLDTQGSELYILEGAKDILREAVFGLEVEVEFAPMYKDQPMFSDVDRFMDRAGFQLFDLKNYFWKRSNGKVYGEKRGQLIMGDAVYFRKIDGIKRLINQIKDPNERKAKILKMISIACLYGYADYAVQISDELANHFNFEEMKHIKDWFNQYRVLANRIPHFRGQYSLARLLYSIFYFFNPAHNGWGYRERPMGRL